MNYKIVFILFFLVVGSIASSAQIGVPEVIGNATLATTSIGKSVSIGTSSIPVCTPRSYACNTPASLNYIFIGSGNWDFPENWTNDLVPPATLAGDYEIIINPDGNGECILNVAQTITQGTKLTILPGKKLIIAGGKFIQ